MRKVFIPNKSIHDFSEAEKYGELVYLSNGNMPRYKTSRIYRLFTDILDTASPDDFVLVSGLTILNIIATLIMQAKFGYVNLLLFKSTDNGNHYIERTIKIGE